MVDFLVHKFVKDYQNVENARVRTEYGVMASTVGIICNILLFTGKFMVGLVLHSVSVQADAFNNLSDAASSVVGFVGVKMASKPADKDHPFGHGRIEYIAALIVSFLVIEVGLSFLKTAVGKIWEPEELSFSTISVLVLLISIGVKLWMAYFNRKLGKRIHSSVMMATATDAMGDVVTTSAAVLSLLFCRFTGINIDGIVGALVSLVVMWAGVGIAKEEQDRVFRSFEQVGRNPSKQQGTGLGLSIVKEIINTHGENINVISTEGVGTEFIFTLPQHSEEF